MLFRMQSYEIFVKNNTISYNFYCKRLRFPSRVPYYIKYKFPS